jgi:hypothetical protein
MHSPTTSPPPTATPAVAFPAYEDAMRDIVVGSRAIGPETMRTIVPRTRLRARLVAPTVQLMTRLPVGLRRRLIARASASAQVLRAMRIPEMPPSAHRAGREREPRL